MRGIVCTDGTEWQELEDRVHAVMIADGANQERWSDRIVHPVDGRIAFIAKSRIEKYLSEDELSRVVTLPDDWTPVIEEENL